MMLRLTGGTIIDPANGVDGEVRDLYIEGGRIVAPPAGTAVDREIDCRGKVLMAGGIDLHTHIGGGKVNIARTLLVEDHRAHPMARGEHTRSGCGHAVPSTFTTGYEYARMGYTACFEPALLPSNARHAHLEMADVPMVDKGGYAMLGNDDFLLRLLSGGADNHQVADYVAWTLRASQCLGIKVVNPGGVSAFKFNQRTMDLDEPGPHYGVRPRAILKALSGALHHLGVRKPLHVHCCNLGVPGNVDTTLATLDAVEGLPVHLTHIQFHSYGTEGDRGFSSAAPRLAEAVNASPNVTVDVGQVMFGRTVTLSGDTQGQFRNRKRADPRKWVTEDIECEGGCGVVPFRYRNRNFVNALQWAIGLELFLLVRDPWRIFLTTDHPNGAPFTSYPRLIRLLMDRGFRKEALARIHPEAAAMSTLAYLDREYSLYEIAIMTRAGPAHLLGLDDRGHLGPGAAADIAVYTPHDDVERMFSRADYVLKDGRVIVKDGAVVDTAWGVTHAVHPEYDGGIERQLRDYFERYQTQRLDSYRVADDELAEGGRGGLVTHPARRT